jgi:NADH:ubiquinone oxidoreductase subunit 3 (subunit A)
MNQSTLSDVAHVIQLSVAPVFLLTSVGTILGVLSTRLGRIVDRARVLGDRLSKLPPTADASEGEAMRAEMHLLAARRHLVNLAITYGVCAALFVCFLIAVAFIGSIFGMNMSIAVATLFIAAMVAFVVALLVFLREVLLAVASVRIS